MWKSSFSLYLGSAGVSIGRREETVSKYGKSLDPEKHKNTQISQHLMVETCTIKVLFKNKQSKFNLPFHVLKFF